MSDALEIQSAKFHAFEWLRAEAIKGNKHAEILIVEHARLPHSPSTSKCVPVEEVELAWKEGHNAGSCSAMSFGLGGAFDYPFSRAFRVAGGDLT